MRMPTLLSARSIQVPVGITVCVLPNDGSLVAGSPSSRNDS
jgi:hypothetical protein